jgi:hypothetical protein
MLIYEVAAPNVDATRLAALAEFLNGRADDTTGQKKISTKAFLELASNMGIALSKSQLKQMSQQPPLSNIIANVEGDDNEYGSGEVIFRGAEPEVNDAEQSVDQSRAIVDKMAKRASKT